VLMKDSSTTVQTAAQTALLRVHLKVVQLVFPWAHLKAVQKAGTSADSLAGTSADSLAGTSADQLAHLLADSLADSLAGTSACTSADQMAD